MIHERSCDVAVIGAGPAGLAAALSARKHARRVVLIERDSDLGGILQQCIHPGFGLSRYGKELTGPEYVGREIDEIRKTDITVLLNTMVLSVSPDHALLCVGKQTGLCRIMAKSIVLAMGCRERTRGNLAIPGSRPAGIFTAGAAQRLINRQGFIVGRQVVIVGSGDIGMIMARRLTLEGAEVVAIVEIMDYLAGLNRNLVQCVQDFNLKLMLSHTVTEILGRDRVEGVMIAQVDSQHKPILATQTHYPCDTVLFSVGLVPENELSRAAGVMLSPVTGGPVVNQYYQTSVPGIFACGNVTHVNDLADNVSLESSLAGYWAAVYAQDAFPQTKREIQIQAGAGVRYVCPQKVCLDSPVNAVTFYFRALKPHKAARIVVADGCGPICKKNGACINPGEMVHVTVKTDVLHRLGDQLTFSIIGETP